MKNFIQSIFTYTLFFLLPFSGIAQTYNTADVSALSAFLTSTNGGTLSLPSGWNMALPVGNQWNMANPMDQWYGITWTGANGSTNRRVKSINLADLGYGTSITSGVALTGALPNNFISSSTSSMDSLEVLDISGNRISSGPTTAWVYTSLKLRKVDISENRFGIGSASTLFVDMLSGAYALQEFYAHQYVSTSVIVAGINIPTLPSGVVGITNLDLSYNGFRGSAATLLNQLQSLVTIDLADNKIENLGLASNASIETFILSNNSIDSVVYLKNVIENYNKLKTFAARNAMNTSLSQSYTIWSPFTMMATNPNNDVYIDLSYNKLSGTIDFNHQGYSKLSFLDMSANELTAAIAPTAPITNLTTLKITDNAINQTLDLAWFTQLPNIEILDFSANQFNGTLPDPTPALTAYNLSSLKQLNLSGNLLEGAIRLDWILDAQHIGSPTANNQFESLKLSENKFSEVVHYSGSLIPFNELKYLHLHDNSLQFSDLYQFVRAFKMVHQGNSQGYRLINTLASGEFLYTPQAPVGLGGVRRRNPGHSTMFRPLIYPPILEGSNDTLYNEYTWYRQDTNQGVFNTEFLGRVRLAQINNPLSGANININLGSSAMSTGSLNLLPTNHAHDFGNLGLGSLDSTHNGWIYFSEVRNDSFPGLNIAMVPIRLLVADCYDSLGQVIACQQMLVRFNPDSVAAYPSGLATELFKERIRSEVGAYKVEECQCGDLELWELYDTTNTAEVEQYGTGTRSTAGSSSSKAELLSAEPNYYVESNNYSPPTSPPTALQGTAHPKPTLVAIVDSGTDFDHPYLKNRYWINAADANDDGIDDDNDCVPDNGWGYNFLGKNNSAYDDLGHGTAIAGIIGGFSDYNISQNTGSYDSLALVSLKFTDKEGNGTLYHAACALFHAAQYVDPIAGDSAKIRVVNASWGYYGEPSPSLESAIDYAGSNCGMLIVTSAGNDGVDNDSEAHYPSNFENDNIITVAAVTASGLTLDSYSNYGAQSVDIAARGDEVPPGAVDTSSPLAAISTLWAP